MHPLNPFKWRHFEAEIMLLCVRWYLRYSLSYRDLEEMMGNGAARGPHHRSIAGCSAMPLNWSSAADRT